MKINLTRFRSRTHKYSISGVSWYPNDSGLFITSSLDHTVKVWDTNSLEEACAFQIDSKVYAHSVSASGVVACGAEYPQIRLCDLRTGGSTHHLVAHRGQVFALQWSPRNEYILSSGGMDGTIRLWDIRRAAGCLASLDQHNSGELLGAMNTGHTGACNGLQFTSDGIHLISLGHDERIRVWDLVNGRNTLVGYPPIIRNRFMRNMNPCITDIRSVETPLIFVPSDDGYLLEFQLFEGALVKKAFGVNGRLTSVTGRVGEEEIYTGASDGNILRWRTPPPLGLMIEQVMQPSKNVLKDIYEMSTNQETRFA
ncbi:DNA excision repair protein ERCC-8 [Neolecta irregularis DAH-3]|uniref:DNA excision repair protein ERCC-8 n=1 Tax=Neolecta irregularis (strain DAH-3) TaxID=1198029 RepID=A0A1U7LRF0_NEOID|nr:DNA excision repair protein ERCC-8 [Neolecta irregularis DAH-3]|eukprot:OLL25250.1 DNA excision repair protein ERCC-8 [Neolecta irregularis DAH-3]